MSDNDNISRTISQYKDWDQLAQFAQAQQTTIVQISKKIQRLEEERDHLKTLLESSVPLIKTESDSVNESTENDSEYICTLEIAKLKKISIQRALTYEEVKRLEIHFKMLTQINSRPNKQEKDVKELSNDRLLELIESKDVAGKK